MIPAGPRPLPSVGNIWLNIVLFGWFLGIGLIYGIVRSIQGIMRSRDRGLSPARYVVPLVFIAAVFLLLVIIGLVHSQSDNSSAAAIPKHVNQVINQPPAGVSAGASAPVAAPVATYPAPGTTLNYQINHSGVVENGELTDSGQTIIAGFNTAWAKACATNNPAVLWGVIQDLQGSEFSDLKNLGNTFCQGRQFTLTGNPTSDPQAAVGSPLRWYETSVRQPDGSLAAATPHLFRLFDTHWLLVDSAVNPDTGLTASGYDATTVVKWMEALRDQAIIQRSPDLLAKYWNGYGDQSDPSVVAAQQALVVNGKNPGTFSITNVKDLGGAILATVSDATGTRQMRYTFVPSANNQPSAYTNQWAAEPEGSN